MTPSQKYLSLLWFLLQAMTSRSKTKIQPSGKNKVARRHIINPKSHFITNSILMKETLFHLTLDQVLSPHNSGLQNRYCAEEKCKVWPSADVSVYIPSGFYLLNFLHNFVRWSFYINISTLFLRISGFMTSLRHNFLQASAIVKPFLRSRSIHGLASTINVTKFWDLKFNILVLFVWQTNWVPNLPKLCADCNPHAPVFVWVLISRCWWEWFLCLRAF